MLRIWENALGHWTCQSMAIESQCSQSRAQTRASWTIETPCNAVKHSYSSIKLNECNGVSWDGWSNPGDLRTLNILNPLGTLSGKLSHYLARKVSPREHELQSIKDSARCTITADSVWSEKRKNRKVILCCWERIRMKGSLARSRWQQPRESLDRSFVEANVHESRFASSHVARPALFRRIYVRHVSFTCVTPATRRLLRNYAYNCGVS